MWEVPGVTHSMATILSRNGRAAMSRRKTSEIRKPGASMPTQTSVFEELFIEVTCQQVGFFFLSNESLQHVCLFLVVKTQLITDQRQHILPPVSNSQCHSVVPLQPWKSDRDIKRDGCMNDHFHRKLKTHPFPHCPTSISKARLAKSSCF